MTVHQFEDKNLAHYSYAILQTGMIAIIDPGRDLNPYMEFAAEHQATIVWILETHPHADFVSGHSELAARSDGTIGCSYLTAALYPHRAVRDKETVSLGEITIEVIETPGHSPDSICFLVHQEDGTPYCLFTGDTLLIGDVGRPDLRENAAGITIRKEDLAASLYDSITLKLSILDPQILVYPAHGAGTLCGKALREANVSTLALERSSNPAMQFRAKEDFTAYLLRDQPYIPAYFPFDVGLNIAGAPFMDAALNQIKTLQWTAFINSPKKGRLIIDTRDKESFRRGHLKGAFNLQNGLKFETWLGSVVYPNESFILAGSNLAELKLITRRIAKIGYETHIEGLLVYPVQIEETARVVSNGNELDKFKDFPEQFTIVDVRNVSEALESGAFKDALVIPLPELRERYGEIPNEKPLVVHCQGGYRSALAASMLDSLLDREVLDLGESILDYLGAWQQVAAKSGE